MDALMPDLLSALICFYGAGAHRGAAPLAHRSEGTRRGTPQNAVADYRDNANR